MQKNNDVFETAIAEVSARLNEMKQTIEKRQHPRFDFRETVKVFPVVPSKSGHIYEVQNKSVEFEACDISEGGLGLKAGHEFDGEIVLKMNFEVEKNQPVVVFGKVVWSEEKHLGVRFLMIDPEMRKSIRTLAKKVG